MSLYGREGNNLFGGPPPTNTKLPNNELELGARNLPRPRRRKTKRDTEVSLYPSLADIDASIPETVIAIDDTGSFEVVKLEGKNGNDGDEELPDASNNSSKQPSQQAPEASAPRSRRQSQERAAEASSLRIPSMTDHSCSLGSRDSNSSGGSQELHREFNKISLSVKRKPNNLSHRSLDGDGGSGSPIRTPRRKVSRHGSRLSVTSDESQDSLPHSPSLSTRSGGGGGDDDGRKSSKSSSSSNNRHRRTSNGSHPTTTDKKHMNSSRGSKGTKNTSSRSKLGSLSKSSDKKNMSLRRLPSDDPDEDGSSRLTPQQQQQRSPEVEIEPGLFLPLRGSEETLQAIKSGFVEELFCQACEVELLCIADASFCICPDCKCLSSVNGMALFTTKNSSIAAGSVGLGFRADNRLYY